MNTSQRVLLWIVSVLAIALTMYFLLPSMDKRNQSASDAVENSYGNAADNEEVNHRFALTVELTQAAQQLASIKSQSLMESFFTPELRAAAIVMPTQDLRLARSRCVEAEMSLRLAHINEQQISKELSRLRTLQQATSSVALKEVNYAQTNLLLAQAELALKQQLTNNCYAEVRQQWPSPIADWVIKGGDEFDLLMAREQSLIKVTLPVNQRLNPNVTTVRWRHNTQPETGGQAQRLAAAFMADPVLNGETWYFLNKASSLREGARLQVWVSSSESTLSGVIIPYQSIVWYAGQPWAYLRIDNQRFQRISLANGLNSIEGVHLQQGLYPGDAVVTSGAQTLLSEEFKWQIHDEDDDD